VTRIAHAWSWRLLARAAPQSKKGVAVPIGAGDFPDDGRQGTESGPTPLKAVRQHGDAVSLISPDSEQLRARLDSWPGEQVILFAVPHRLGNFVQAPLRRGRQSPIDFHLHLIGDGTHEKPAAEKLGGRCSI
jgi:hypothetical protein